MLTYCSACGSPLTANVSFCPNCGTLTPSYHSHSGLSSSDPTMSSIGANARLQQVWTRYGSSRYKLPDKNPYDQLNPYQIIPPPPPPPRKRSSMIIGIISSVVVATLILGVVGIFVLPTLGRGSISTHTTTSSLTPAASPTTITSLAPTALATRTQVPSQSCGGAFSDEFHSKLDSRWNWVNPTGNATYNMATKGFLSLSTPPNSDINPTNNFNAPRLLQHIDGDFTVETLVDLQANTFFQSAGILIWQSQTRFLRFERGYADRNGVFLQEDNNGLFSDVSLLAQHPSSARPIELRLQRKGDHFTASWRELGQVWQAEGETDLHFDSPMAGLDLLATYTAPPTTALYDYFRVSCP